MTIMAWLEVNLLHVNVDGRRQQHFQQNFNFFEKKFEIQILIVIFGFSIKIAFKLVQTSLVLVNSGS